MNRSKTAFTLTAQQERIAELEAQRDDYGDDAAQLRAKNDVLIEERDALRAQLAEAWTKKNRYLKALYNIIDAWDGNDDSISSDPAEIAKQALSDEDVSDEQEKE